MNIHVEQNIINGTKTAHANNLFITIPEGVSGMKIAFETWLKQQMRKAGNDVPVTFTYSDDVKWGSGK